MIRGKVKLVRSTQFDYDEKVRELTFSAISDDGTPENQRFAKYTPNGDLRLLVNNPLAVEKFELGKSYYIDFTPADPVVAEAATTAPVGS